MSVTCCMILLSLVCLNSLHSCNARRLGDEVVMKPEDKVEEKVGVDKIIVGPKMKSSSTNEKRDVRGESSGVVTVSTGKLKDTKALGSISNRDQKGKLSPAASVRTESLASVSWRVPHKKRGEKQPGFNLDYSPPKTHPPSHN